MASGNETSISPSNISSVALKSVYSIENILKISEESATSFNQVSTHDSVPNRISAPSKYTDPGLFGSRAYYHNFSSSCSKFLAPGILGSFSTISFAPNTTQMIQFAFPSNGYHADFGAFQRRRAMPVRRSDRRPVFTPRQIKTLENQFLESPYLTLSKRADLAMKLKLTEKQVKTWFQNRRTKKRRETKEKCDPPLLERQKYWKEAYERFLQQQMAQHGSRKIH